MDESTWACSRLTDEVAAVLPAEPTYLANIVVKRTWAKITRKRGMGFADNL